MEDIESTLKEVYEFCHQSPKQRREFGWKAKVLEEDLSYLNGVKNMRCVACRYRAMTAIRINLRVTIDHLKSVKSEKNHCFSKQILWSWIS